MHPVTLPPLQTPNPAAYPRASHLPTAHQILPVLASQLQVTISTEQLNKRLDAMAQEINQYYGNRPLTMIVVMKGAIFFATDLAKRLTMPLKMEFIRLASYHGGTQSNGKVQAVDLSLPNLAGKDVLVVEDIIDTGRSMKFLVDYLANLKQASSIRIATLLDKPTARVEEAKEVKPDFTGFETNGFVVGYGLDFDDKKGADYRNLPYIGTVQNPQALLSAIH